MKAKIDVLLTYNERYKGKENILLCEAIIEGFEHMQNLILEFTDILPDKREVTLDTLFIDEIFKGEKTTYGTELTMNDIGLHIITVILYKGEEVIDKKTEKIYFVKY